MSVGVCVCVPPFHSTLSSRGRSCMSSSFLITCFVPCTRWGSVSVCRGLPCRCCLLLLVVAKSECDSWCVTTLVFSFCSCVGVRTPCTCVCCKGGYDRACRDAVPRQDSSPFYFPPVLFMPADHGQYDVQINLTSGLTVGGPSKLLAPTPSVLLTHCAGLSAQTQSCWLQQQTMHMSPSSQLRL